MNPSPQNEPPATSFYEIHFARLMEIAIFELHLSEEQAATLIHDILLASAVHPKEHSDIESWLDGALRTGAQRLVERSS